MKLGDMTFKQIAKLCKKHDDCLDCPLFDESPEEMTPPCRLINHAPMNQHLDMEIKENEN